MDYKTMCLVTAARDGGQAYTSSPQLVHVGAHMTFADKLQGGLPGEYGPQVKGGVSSRQTVHAGIWAEPQVQSACEMSVQVHTSVC